MAYMRYLGVGLAVLIGCIACVVLAVLRSRPNPIALSLQIQYTYIALVWIGWQVLGQTALQPDYFAYPLYPAMFFALAAIAASWQYPKNSGQNHFLSYLALAVVVTAPLAFSLGDYLSRWPQHAALIVLALALLCVGLLAANGGRLVLILAGVLSFAEMNALAAVHSAGRHYALVEPCKDLAGAYRALVDSERFLARFVRSTSDMFLWYNQSEVLRDEAGCEMPVSYFAPSLASLGLFPYLAPPWPVMPQADALPQAAISMLTSERKIAIVTADYSNVEALESRFRRAGINVGIEGQTIVRTSRVQFDLYVLGLNAWRPVSEKPGIGK
jgi:hypothetical protein